MSVCPVMFVRLSASTIAVIIVLGLDGLRSIGGVYIHFVFLQKETPFSLFSLVL